MSEFYDVVDFSGNVIETAAEQQAQVEAASATIEMKDEVTEQGKDIILQRAQPQLTPLEQRKLRKQYVTITLARVLACGHRLDLGRQPRHRNCESCWFAFFNEHGELVNQCDEMFKADGGKLMSQLQGFKFTKRFTQFMATLAKWKQQEENVSL